MTDDMEQPLTSNEGAVHSSGNGEAVEVPFTSEDDTLIEDSFFSDHEDDKSADTSGVHEDETTLDHNGLLDEKVEPANGSVLDQISIDPDTLARIADLTPNYDDIHNHLLSVDNQYVELVELISNESVLDNYLFRNNEEYQQLSSKEDKEIFRQEVSNVLKSHLADQLTEAGDRYLVNHKQHLLNEVRLNDFSNFLSQEDSDLKAITAVGDSLYESILKERSLEDTTDNRDFFNKAINSFIIDMSQAFGMNEKNFARQLGKVISLKGIDTSTMQPFQDKISAIQKAKSKAKSITSQGVDVESSVTDEDDSWARFGY